jgi:CheY-like chemotaxis protein
VVADGSGEITLLFLGRPHVAGVTPGRQCTAEGRACVYQESLVIWNPRYVLEPDCLPSGPAADRGSPEGGPREGRVLVIGDDPGMRRIIEINLAARGCRVNAAVTGALIATGNGFPVRRNPGLVPDVVNPDLVILDMGLSRAQGVALIGVIRASSTAPILVISGLDGGAVNRSVLAAGASDFLVKPFPIDALLARAAACLDGGE